MPANTPLPTLREEYLRKRRNKRLLRYGIIFLIFAAVVAALSYVSHRKEFTISKVTLSGGVLVTEEEVSAQALEYMHGSYLWIFPIRNALWYPRKDLEKYLRETFSRIDTIHAHLENAHTLTVDITERQPYAIWCKNVFAQATSTQMEDGSDLQNCYFMDSNSTIFAPAPDFSGDAYFKYYGLIEGGNPIGQNYMSSSTEFLGIADLIAAVKKLSLRPQYLIAKGDNQFSLVISGGGQIYFDTKKPLETTIENLQALLRNTDFSTSTGAGLPVDYIDLRFGNKLFYKLKGQ